MGVKITDRDNGYKKLMRAADGSRQGRRLRVGVHGDSETEQVGAWQEFGTKTIPSRSYVRAWFDENRPRIKDDLRGVGVAVLRGQGTRDELLTKLGKQYVAEVREKILAGIEPELRESTVEQKAAAGDPLIPLVTQEAKLLHAIHAMLDDEVVG